VNLQVNRERIEWIDFCKFIAIFYMVWGHVGMPISADKYIHVFHMPIFFFLSGFVFNFSRIENFKKFLMKKIKTLLVPYFIFSIGIYYFWYIFYKIVNKPCPESQLNLWKGIFTYNADISPFGAVQWFLTCLLLVEVFFYVVIRITKNSKIILTFVLLTSSLLGYFCYSILNSRLYWGADIALTAVVFYGAGYLLNNIKNKQIKLFIFSPTLFKIIIFLLVSVASSFLNEYVNMRTLQYGNFFLYYLSSFTSIIMYIMLGIYVCNVKTVIKSKVYRQLLYIGQNTIIVLVLNNFVIQMLERFTGYAPVINKIFGNLVFSILVIILMIPVALLINKYFPWIIGKKGYKNQRKICNEINN